MYTENLDGWENLKNTDSCYLPGNYFYKVFVKYPGLLANPMHIKIRKNKSGERNYVHMKETNINKSVPGLLRLVIETPETVHSNLLILDYERGTVHRFEPLGANGPYFELVNTLIEDYLSAFFNFDLEVIEADFGEILDEKNPKCKKSGFCAAYNILYGYCFLNQKPFLPDDIRKFARKIEETYGLIPEYEHEVEYQGFLGNDNPNQGRNMAIGGISGATLGAVAFGPVGLIAAGLGGAALGSIA
jgi:hypothetical protein